MDQLINLILQYIHPAFWVIAPIIFLMAQKIKSTKLDNKYIPIAIAVAGTLTGGLISLLMDSFTVSQGLIQGLLISGLEVLGYNILRELNKPEIKK
jgi:hypothetical protein